MAEAAPADDRHETEEVGFSPAEVDEIEERSNPSTPVVFEVLRREGEKEMDRPLVSLWWSGAAAGLSIAFSLIAEAVLRQRLPDAPWSALVAHLGYTAGFVIVVLGRQQLFTENTLTAVLPVMKAFHARNLMRLGRLWSVVLVANLAGCAVAAALCRFPPSLPPEIVHAMVSVAHEELTGTPWVMFCRAVPAGFVIAAMVWLLPAAGSAQLFVIVGMTWLISAAGLRHVIVGSVSAFFLLMSREMNLGDMILGFLLPVLAGNIVGGTGLFALISYGQVAKEI